MATQIFDNSQVRKHPIFTKAGSLLANVCVRDYGHNPFDERIECLDMDAYEASVCVDRQRPTMDAVMGVAEYAQNKKTQGRLLMVELRLGYESTRGLKSDSLNGKVLHTLELLNSAQFQVDKRAVFVFGENVYQQAVSWMAANSHSNLSRREWVVMSPDLFAKAYPAQEDLPYEPMHDYEKGTADLVCLIDSRSWAKVYSSLKWWGNRYNKYYHISGETERIAKLVSEMWQLLLSHRAEMDEESVLYFNIFADDYPVFRLDEL